MCMTFIHVRTSECNTKLAYMLQNVLEGRRGSFLTAVVKYGKSVLPLYNKRVCDLFTINCNDVLFK